MAQRTDVIFVPQVEVNEGPPSNAVTPACLVGTQGYLFLCPPDMRPALEALLADPHRTEREIERELTARLSADASRRRIFPTHQLEVFVINVGFWVVGGVTLRMAGEGRKVLNIPGKPLRQRLRDFYAPQLK